MVFNLYFMGISPQLEKSGCSVRALLPSPRQSGYAPGYGVYNPNSPFATLAPRILTRISNLDLYSHIVRFACHRRNEFVTRSGPSEIARDDAPCGATLILSEGQRLGRPGGRGDAISMGKMVLYKPHTSVLALRRSQSETAVAGEPSGLSFLDRLPRPSSAPFEDDQAIEPVYWLGGVIIVFCPPHPQSHLKAAKAARR
jgi:hypothetical protein